MIPHYGLTDAEAYELEQWSAALARVDHGDAADPSTEPRACPEGWALVTGPIHDPSPVDEAQAAILRVTVGDEITITCELCCEAIGPRRGHYHPTQHIGRHIRCPAGD